MKNETNHERTKERYAMAQGFRLGEFLNELHEKIDLGWTPMWKTFLVKDSIFCVIMGQDTEAKDENKHKEIISILKNLETNLISEKENSELIEGDVD